MATISQNGINFNNYKPQTEDTVNMGQWPIVLAGQIDPDEDGGIINAVQIDWNGAVLPNGNPENAGNLTIDTTGDLLKTINDMQEQIYVLTSAVIALAQKVNQTS
jgi:hypothetical protein